MQELSSLVFEAQPAALQCGVASKPRHPNQKAWEASRHLPHLERCLVESARVHTPLRRSSAELQRSSTEPHINKAPPGAGDLEPGTQRVSIELAPSERRQACVIRQSAVRDSNKKRRPRPRHAALQPLPSDAASGTRRIYIAKQMLAEATRCYGPRPQDLTSASKRHDENGTSICIMQFANCTSSLVVSCQNMIWPVPSSTMMRTVRPRFCGVYSAICIGSVVVCSHNTRLSISDIIKVCS